MKAITRLSPYNKIYKISFKGKVIGALGKSVPFTETVNGLDFKTASLTLYDKYNHIEIIKVNGKKYDPLNPPA